MLKQLLIFTVVYFCCVLHCDAQKKGMLPLTGLQYYEEGISTQSMAIKINGQQLYGNRVPLNQDIEMSFLQPTGFIADKKKIYFAAAEYTLVSAKGDVLLTKPNLLVLNETKGFTAKDFKMLAIKLHSERRPFLGWPARSCGRRRRRWHRHRRVIRSGFPGHTALPLACRSGNRTP